MAHRKRKGQLTETGPVHEFLWTCGMTPPDLWESQCGLSRLGTLAVYYPDGAEVTCKRCLASIAARQYNYRAQKAEEGKTP